MEETVLKPGNTAEVQEMVRKWPHLIPAGAGTKWSLADAPGGSVVLDTTGLDGVTGYEPEEFTVAVRAGTPLARVQALLAENGQFLPFDPLLVETGASVGGTVAVGVSGAARLRYGGLRDFILGIELVDGRGGLVRAGGRVVKNAAGLDLPKLVCGSRGRFGVLTEVIFKVFPLPEAFATLEVHYASIEAAAGDMKRLLRSPLEPLAVELAAPGLLGDDYRLYVRVGGPKAVLEQRLARIERELGGRGGALPPVAEEALWRDFRELAFAQDAVGLLRLSLTLAQVEELEGLLAPYAPWRLYSQGGSAAWLVTGAGPDWGNLARILAERGIPAQCWRGGPTGISWLVPPPGATLARRVKEVLDPDGRFPPI